MTSGPATASPAIRPGVTNPICWLHFLLHSSPHLGSFLGKASLPPNHTPAGISKTSVVEALPIARKERQDAQTSADEARTDLEIPLRESDCLKLLAKPMPGATLFNIGSLCGPNILMEPLLCVRTWSGQWAYSSKLSLMLCKKRQMMNG